MKATKDNCTSVLYDSDSTCSLDMNSNKAEGARVVEVPKVWREGGKQYKVETFYGPVLDKHLTIKAPRGCWVNTYGDTDVEYYD